MINWDVNNLYAWAMAQKFENTSWFSKSFIENYNEDSGEGYFLEVVVQYPEKFRLSSTYFLCYENSETTSAWTYHI